MHVTTIGLDLAKNVFRVHGVTEAGEVVLNRSLRRAHMHRFFESIPRCLVGIEACGTSHYWAREIAKLGNEVRLIPPAYVKLYVKRGKLDAIGAAAICEAVKRSFEHACFGQIRTGRSPRGSLKSHMRTNQPTSILEPMPVLQREGA